MKIVFVGAVESSYKKLERLIHLKADVVGVVTKESSPFNADHVDLSPLCKQHNIPFNYAQTSINDADMLTWIKEKAPDIIFVFGWSQLIKQELLSLPPMGIVGFHPAALPMNRGRHPLIWALVLGLENTASTFFFMDEGADSGKILSQHTLAIAYEDDARTLYDKMIHTALTQIDQFLPQLQSGKYPAVAQDHSKANLWRKRGKKDGEIDFRMSAKAIYNLVRALTKPYVGAHVHYNDQDVSVWRVEEVLDVSKNIEPGKVLESNAKAGTFVVKCSDHAIRFIDHDFATVPEEGSYL